MVLENLLRIAALLSLVSFIILAIFFMVFLSSANKFAREAGDTLNRISKDFLQLKEKLINSLTSIDSLAARSEKSLDKFDQLQEASTESMRGMNELKSKAVDSMTHIDGTADEMQKTFKSIGGRLDNVFGIFEPFKKLSNDVYTRVAPPVMQATNIITSAYHAVTVFLEYFEKGKKPERGSEPPQQQEQEY